MGPISSKIQYEIKNQTNDIQVTAKWNVNFENFSDFGSFKCFKTPKTSFSEFPEIKWLVYRLFLFNLTNIYVF